jgi:hypothetical protein
LFGRQTSLPERKQAGEVASPAFAKFRSTADQSAARAAITAILTITAVSTATAAGRTVFTRAGDVDRQRAALKFLVVEELDGLVRFVGAAHLNEGETAGLAGELVNHDVDRGDNTSGGKVILQIVFHRLVGEIAHKEA